MMFRKIRAGIVFIVCSLFLLQAVSGDWFDQFEEECSDSLDNDIDGFTDCSDTDCNGTLSGVVTNSQGSILEQAKVEVFDSQLSLVTTLFTNSSGGYEAAISCGTYNLVVTESSYVTSTQNNVDVPAFTEVSEDFTLHSGQTCESDCTLTGDTIVQASCNGVNNCSFYDSTALSVCNNAQPGWIKDYNTTHTIECADGVPQARAAAAPSDVTCSGDNLIKLTRVVNYQGKLVKLVVVTCG